MDGAAPGGITASLVARPSGGRAHGRAIGEASFRVGGSIPVGLAQAVRAARFTEHVVPKP